MERLANNATHDMMGWDNIEASTIHTPNDNGRDDSVVHASVIVMDRDESKAASPGGKRSLGVGPISYGVGDTHHSTPKILQTSTVASGKKHNLYENDMAWLEVRMLNQEVENLREYNHNVLWELQTERKEIHRLQVICDEKEAQIEALLGENQSYKDFSEDLRVRLALSLEDVESGYASIAKLQSEKNCIGSDLTAKIKMTKNKLAANASRHLMYGMRLQVFSEWHQKTVKFQRLRCLLKKVAATFLTRTTARAWNVWLGQHTEARIVKKKLAKAAAKVHTCEEVY